MSYRDADVAARIVQSRGAAARRAPHVGPSARPRVNLNMGEWAGPGSSHASTQLAPRCPEATFLAGAETVRSFAAGGEERHGGVRVAVDRYAAGDMLPTVRQWREAAEQMVREADPQSAVRVATELTGGALVALAVGDCDSSGGCCCSSDVQRYDDDPWNDVDTAPGTSPRSGFVAASARCGGCDGFVEQSIYAAAASAVVNDSAGDVDNAARVSAGQGSIADSPAAVLPQARLFAQQIVAAVRHERRRDVRRVLDTMARVGSGTINLGAAYVADTGGPFDAAAVFDAVALMCSHHGITCTDATAQELIAAAADGLVGYRNEIVCRIGNVTGYSDGTVSVDATIGYFSSDVEGCIWAETHGGIVHLDGARGSEWTLQMVDLHSADLLYEDAGASLSADCTRVVEPGEAAEAVLGL